MGIFSGGNDPTSTGDWRGAWDEYTGVQGTRETNDANLQIARETNAQNLEIFREGNTFSAKEADKNRMFQERMSSTAHQRAAKDLQKAGLNRILAVTQGGASQPAGAGASTTQTKMERAHMEDIKEGRNLATALQIGKTIAEIKNTEAKTANTAEDTKRKQQGVLGGTIGTKAGEAYTKLQDNVANSVKSTAKNIKQQKTDYKKGGIKHWWQEKKKRIGWD